MNSPGQAGTRALLVHDKHLSQLGHQDSSTREQIHQAVTETKAVVLVCFTNQVLTVKYAAF